VKKISNYLKSPKIKIWHIIKAITISIGAGFISGTILSIILLAIAMHILGIIKDPEVATVATDITLRFAIFVSFLWFVRLYIRKFSRKSAIDTLRNALYDEVRDEIDITFDYNGEDAALGRKMTDLPGEVFLYIINYDYDNDTAQIKRAKVSEISCDKYSTSDVQTIPRLGVGAKPDIKTTIRTHYTLNVVFADGNVDNIEHCSLCSSILESFQRLRLQSEIKTDNKSRWEQV
jgi:hypothetical protein